MTVSVRFAPSPTGYLHVGNVRTALINWLFARKEGGRFLLRIDDTDKERSRAEYEHAIEEDLRWLGITWDEKMRQSERVARYEAAKATLMAGGRLYPCYETSEELEIKRKMQLSRGLPPIYDRASLALSDEDRKKYENQGRQPHFRFRLEDTAVAWDDLIRGPVRFEARHLGDPVLVRADGVPLYTLASVVDDGEYGISHIVRGEDHVSNTAVQLQLFEALGFTPPRFAHMALLTTKEGEMSKRLGGNDVRSLREAGILPMAVNSYLARLGTSDAVEPLRDLAALVAGFHINRLGRATAYYDARDIEKLNEKLIRNLPYEEARIFLTEMDEHFWHSVRGNVASVADVYQWWTIISQDVKTTLTTDEVIYMKQACDLLPPEPWDTLTWDRWVAALRERTGRSGKGLYAPLRRALTGMEHGPELKLLLPLLGRTKAMQRLSGAYDDKAV